jgi:hypothetical protein
VNGYHPGGPPWWTQVDATALEVAEALGLPVVRRSCACPACGAERRSSRNPGDRRGPVGFKPEGQGWRCFRCGAGGSARDLAAWKLTGRAWERGDRETAGLLRAWFADHGWCEPAPGAPRSPRPPCSRPTSPPATRPEPEPQHPPQREVADLWGACRRVDFTGADPDPLDLELSFWMSCERQLFPPAVADLDLARILPAPSAHPFPAWLPSPWWPRYRLALPAWTAAGELGSLRLRSPGSAQPKERAPAAGPGSAKGLTLADPVALALLRGEPDPRWAGSVVIAEGCTDYLTWAVRKWQGKRPAILGVWCGSWTADLAARIPSGTRVSIRTDNDPAGERMASTITKTLAATCQIHRKRPSEKPWPE